MCIDHYEIVDEENVKQPQVQHRLPNGGIQGGFILAYEVIKHNSRCRCILEVQMLRRDDWPVNIFM